MKKKQIDYGIDLGTTNSAISRIENGVSKTLEIDLILKLFHLLSGLIVKMDMKLELELKINMTLLKNCEKEEWGEKA